MVESWSGVVQKSWAALQERQTSTFASLPPWEHWHYDLDEAVLDLFQEGDLVRQFRIVVAGTTSEAEGTWLWSWANESLPPVAVHGITAVRDFGEANGYEGLTIPEWPAEQPAVADVVSVAGDVLGAIGFFRAPDRDVTTYLLLDPA